MARKFLIMFVIAIAAFGCDESESEPQELTLARLQAEQLLEHLRSHEWALATGYVLINTEAMSRFGLPPDAQRPVVISRVQELFRRLYERQPPGPIVALRLDPDGPGDTRRVLVSYRHGDFDSFYMRLVGGRWLYSFE